MTSWFYFVILQLTELYCCWRDWPFESETLYWQETRCSGTRYLHCISSFNVVMLSKMHLYHLKISSDAFCSMPSTYCHSSSSNVVQLYTQSGIHLSLIKDQMMHFMVWTFCFGSSSQNLSLKRAKEIYCCLVLLF